VVRRNRRESVDSYGCLRCTPRVRRNQQVRGAKSRAARATGVLTAVVGCVLLLMGCGGPSDEVVRTSGALAEGFEIEPGSALIGAVFPTPYPYGGEGRQAVLRVDGDARRVFDGYVRQAEDLGYSFDLESNPDRQWCRVDPVQPFPVICSANGSRPDDKKLSLQGRVEPDGQGYIHLSTEVQSDDPPPFTSVPEGPAAPLTDVELAPDLASTTDEPPIRLVEDSALLFDPYGAAGSYTAMLEVTGELTPVLRAYEEQFRSAGFTSPEGLINIDNELIIAAEQAGGGPLTAVGVAGDRSYVLIQRTYD
jgi:hypothetical protein